MYDFTDFKKNINAKCILALLILSDTYVFLKCISLYPLSDTLYYVALGRYNGIEHHKPCMMLPDFKLIGKRRILQMSQLQDVCSTKHLVVCLCVYLERRVCGKAN